MAETAIEASVRRFDGQRAVIRLWLSRVGLLGVLAALALASGLLVQHLAHLPPSYDWLFPYRVLWDVVLASAGFPSVVLLVALVGWRSAGVPLRAELPVERQGRLVLVLIGAATAWLDALLFERHAPWDWASAGLLVALAWSKLRRGVTPMSSLRALGSLTYGVAVFASVCFFYTVLKAALFLHATPQDASIVAFESKLFGAPPYRAVAAFAETRPHFVAACDWIYFKIFHHMLLTAVLLATRGNRDERDEYLSALCLCYLFGAVLYHLCPAWGPSYFEPNQFNYLSDGRLTTSAVRSWLWLNTQGVTHGEAVRLYPWSYIACMPSLHVSHELVMAFYSRRPLPALIASVAFTVATLVSVVVLGWHYALDWVGGAALAAVAIVLAGKMRGISWPRFLKD